jgi:hypothetical protein
VRHVGKGLLPSFGSALAATLALVSCASTPGIAETDRIATTVATAISDPRPHSADGLVRAALATPAGRDSGLTVVESEELQADELADPLARLVFRVHLEASGTGFSSTDAVTACYEARFNFYGVIGSPRRIECPAGATAIVPAPLPPEAQAVIPPGFDDTLAELLAALPAAPSAADITAAVTTALPVPGVDPTTGLRDLPPAIEATVDGADIGISLWAPSGRHCLLGARVDGRIGVGRPSRVQLQPGELSCEPQTALHLFTIAPPH